MKPIKTMLLFTAFLFSITACEKKEDLTDTTVSGEIEETMSSDEAVEIMAAILTSEVAGANQQVEDATLKALEIIAELENSSDNQSNSDTGNGNDTINGNDNGDRDRDRDRDQDSIGCGNGFEGDTTISGNICDSVNNDYSYDYSYDHRYYYNFNEDSIPDSINCNFNQYGFTDAPRYHLQDSCSGYWQLHGLSPDSSEYHMNGYCYHSGLHQSKVRNQNMYTIRIAQTLTDLTIGKTIQEIESGSAKIQLKAQTSTGYSYSYSAQVKFMGNGIAELTLNNSIYNINLSDGTIEE